MNKDIKDLFYQRPADEDQSDGESPVIKYSKTVIEEKTKVKKLDLNPFALDQVAGGVGQDELYGLLCALNLGYLFPQKQKVMVNTLFNSLTKLKVSLNNLKVDDLKRMSSQSKQQDEVEFLDEASDMIDLD